MKYLFPLFLLFLSCHSSTSGLKKDETTDDKNRHHIKFEILPFPDEMVKSTFAILRNRLSPLGDGYDFDMSKKDNIISISFIYNDSINKIIRYLTAPGKLEFLETYSVKDFYPYLQAANKKAVTFINAKSEEPKKKYSSLDSAVLDKNPDPLFELFQVLSVPNEETISITEGPIIGTVSADDTAKLMRLLNSDSLKSTFPDDVRFMLTAKPDWRDPKLYSLYATRNPDINGGPVTIGIISRIRANTDINGRYEIDIDMSEKGANMWAQLTARNINKTIVIALEGRVLSGPRVEGEIVNGKMSITGDFTEYEAKDLADLIRGGTMPQLPIKLIEVK